MTTTKKYRTITVALAAATVLAVGVPAANAAVTGESTSPVSTAEDGSTTGWAGVTRQPVRIDLGNDWITQGEFDFPSGAKGRLPVVVLLHGSGHNDMDQSMPDGKGSTFVPLSQAITHQGYAVLRFNKRGVTGVGPVLTDDQAQLAPPKPYEQIVRDAAAVVRFAATSSRVDSSRIFLLGHSEGTQVAANLAAAPNTYGIPKPAGVIEMGVVGLEVKQLVALQIFGRLLAQLHAEFDVNGDGDLTATEAADGLIGQPNAVADTFRSVLLDGQKVLPATDKDHDGKLTIDTEVGPVLRQTTGIDAYPNLPGLDQPIKDYLVDIARFGTVTGDLPRFTGPTLMLNGESDIQTPARAALVADAAVGASGNQDHKIIIYPGMAHTMNITPMFTPDFGSPDPAVLKDVRRWLQAHR